MTRKIGKTDAVRAWRRSRLAVTSLSAHLRTLGIEAQTRNALYLAGNKLDAAALRREADARMAAGFETLFLSRKELKDRFGIKRSGALFGYDNLAADPRAMTAALLKDRSAQRRAHLFAGKDRERGIPKNIRRRKNGNRPNHPRKKPDLRHRLRIAERRADQRPQDHLDLGDRDQAAEKETLAGRMPDLGGVRSLSLYAHLGRRARDLRRRGRRHFRRERTRRAA